MAIVSDIDGNYYTTIIIGTQEWMVENLKTTRLNDGTPIPEVTGSAWYSLTTPAYCWYNNDIGYKTPYGAMYNAYVVETGKLAPVGWRVPTWVEVYYTMRWELGGWTNLGGKMKETGTAHWLEPNVGATNSSRWTGVGGGLRADYYAFNYIKDLGYWWTSTPYDSTRLWCFMLSRTIGTLYANQAAVKMAGASVRCVRDLVIKKPKYWVVKNAPSEIDGSILELNRQRLKER